jgi:hypothetical protein
MTVWLTPLSTTINQTGGGVTSTGGRLSSFVFSSGGRLGCLANRALIGASFAVSKSDCPHLLIPRVLHCSAWLITTDGGVTTLRAPPKGLLTPRGCVYRLRRGGTSAGYLQNGVDRAICWKDRERHSPIFAVVFMFLGRDGRIWVLLSVVRICSTQGRSTAAFSSIFSLQKQTLFVVAFRRLLINKQQCSLRW